MEEETTRRSCDFIHHLIFTHQNRYLFHLFNGLPKNNNYIEDDNDKEIEEDKSGDKKNENNEMSKDKNRIRVDLGSWNYYSPTSVSYIFDHMMVPQVNAFINL